MSEPIMLNKKCPHCSNDKWTVSNEPKYYIEICIHCGHMNEIRKQDYIDNFICKNCNCLECTIEENKKFIATRCKHCGNQEIVLEKFTTVEHTQQEIDKTLQPTQSNLPKCPTCSSTRIQKISGGRKLMGAIGFGLLSKTAKSQFECLDCKYMW